MRALALALTLSLALPAHALSKCVDTNGKVSGQDLPCEGNHQQTEIKAPVFPAPPPGAALPSKEVQRYRLEQAMEKDRLARDMRVNDAIARKQVVIGMTEDELRRAQGSPAHINTDSYGTAQWVFHDGAWAKYVYVERGVVRSWQSR